MFSKNRTIFSRNRTKRGLIPSLECLDTRAIPGAIGVGSANGFAFHAFATKTSFTPLVPKTVPVDEPTSGGNFFENGYNYGTTADGAIRLRSVPSQSKAVPVDKPTSGGKFFENGYNYGTTADGAVRLGRGRRF